MAVLTFTLGEPCPPEVRGGAITIGNFDGVHCGHQALLRETLRQSRLVKGPAVAVTFDPPPSQLLRPEAFQPPLAPLSYRCELLQASGVDHVLILRTSPSLLHLEAREFFDRILRQEFAARAVVEGYNFGFGKGRAGTVAMLEQWGHAAGMTIAPMEAQQYEGKPVSSSRVRADLAAGEVAHARAMLDRPYRLFGVVAVGQRRGRTLGFPTANLTSIPNLVPGVGVYAVRVPLGGKTYGGATHLGPNATFGETTPSVEVHLLDFDGDLYGQSLVVDFIHKVRDTKSFASADELKRQIENDVKTTRRILSAR
jgi:riboflavin kinase/FMN adenylyltransferase